MIWNLQMFSILPYNTTLDHNPWSEPLKIKVISWCLNPCSAELVHTIATIPQPKVFKAERRLDSKSCNICKFTVINKWHPVEEIPLNKTVYNFICIFVSYNKCTITQGAFKKILGHNRIKCYQNISYNLSITKKISVYSLLTHRWKNVFPSADLTNLKTLIKENTKTPLQKWPFLHFPCTLTEHTVCHRMIHALLQ